MNSFQTGDMLRIPVLNGYDDIKVINFVGNVYQLLNINTGKIFVLDRSAEFWMDKLSYYNYNTIWNNICVTTI